MLDENAAKYVLETISDLFERSGFTYWIDSGTLLSAYRDKSINIYDHDVDIRMLMSQVDEKEEANIVKKLWELGFRSISNVQNRRAQILASHPIGTGVMLDLKFCEEDETDVWYYCWKEPDPTPSVHLYPKRFWDRMTTIELMGRHYPCPSPIEEYIEHHYGKDWREFKVRADEAEETDLSWDYMHDPPCSLSITDFIALKSPQPEIMAGAYPGVSRK